MFFRISFFVLGLLIFFQLAIGAGHVFAQSGDPESKLREAGQRVQKNILEQGQRAVQAGRDRLDEVKKMKDERLQQIRDLQQEAKKKREELKQELQKKQEEFRAKVEERKTELKKKLGVERAKNIDAFFSRMAEKFEDAIKRLNDLSDRIESRLNDSEASGKDVSAARAKLAGAREKITVAQTSLDGARASYTSAVQSDDFKGAFARVRTVVSGVKEKVKDAHAALVDVVTSLKSIPESSSGEGESPENSNAGE